MIKDLLIVRFTTHSLDLDIESYPSSNGIACDTPFCVDFFFSFFRFSLLSALRSPIFFSFLAYTKLSLLVILGFLVSVWRWFCVLVSCMMFCVYENDLVLAFDFTACILLSNFRNMHCSLPFCNLSL